MSNFIYGVPRELLEVAAEYLKIHGERSSIEYSTSEDIQSLLDAKSQREPVAHLMFEDTFYGVDGPEVGDFDIHYDHDACDKLAKSFPGKQVALYSEPQDLQALSVTNIMLDIVPGDGSGHEVYAKSVADVEAVLTRLYRENEELQDTNSDLLRALQNIENDSGQIPDHAWKLVQDAIAKATTIQ